MRNLEVRLMLMGVLFSTLASAVEIALKDVKTTPWTAYEGSWVIPRYENGFLMSYALDGGAIVLFDETGNRVRDVQIALPDARTERVNATAISQNGQLVASVNGYSSDGKMVDALAWIDSSGAIEKLVRTTPFAVRHLSFADDGTLWTLGDVYDDTFTKQTRRAL